MSQDASIIARLGLDTAGFTRGLEAAARATVVSKRGHVAANESVLASEKKVERQLGSLIERLRGVNSATQAAEVTFRAFAESINLTLATAVGVGGGLAFVAWIRSIGEEARKAETDLAALMKPSKRPEMDSFDMIERRIEALQEKFDALSEKSNWTRIKDFLSDSKIAGGEGGGFAEIAERQVADINGVQQAIAAARQQLLELAEKRKAEADERMEQIGQRASLETTAMRAELDGQKSVADAIRTKLAFEEKIQAARKAGNDRLAQELEYQKQLTLEAQAQSIAAQNKSQISASLAEFAAEGHGAAGATARQIDRLEKRARQRTLHDDQEGAARLQSRANAMRDRIGLLHENEKNKGDLKAALEGAQVLKDIAKNTEKLGVNL